MKRKLKPIKINSIAWFYRNEKSFDFVVECRDSDDRYHKTITFSIQLRKLLGKEKP